MEVPKNVKNRLALHSLNCWLELAACVPVDAFLLYWCLQSRPEPGGRLLYYSVQEITSLNNRDHLRLEHLLINHLAFDCMWMFTTFLLMDVFCVLKNIDRIARRCILQAITIGMVCIVDLFSAIYSGMMAKEVFSRYSNSSTEMEEHLGNPAYSLFIPLYFAKGGIGWLINVTMVFHLCCIYRKLKSMRPLNVRPLPDAPDTIVSDSSMTTNSESNYCYVYTDDQDRIDGHSSTRSALPRPPRRPQLSLALDDHNYLDLMDNESEMPSSANGFLSVVEAPIYATAKSGSNKCVQAH